MRNFALPLLLALVILPASADQATVEVTHLNDTNKTTSFSLPVSEKGESEKSLDLASSFKSWGQLGWQSCVIKAHKTGFGEFYSHLVCKKQNSVVSINCRLRRNPSGKIVSSTSSQSLTIGDGENNLFFFNLKCE